MKKFALIIITIVMTLSTTAVFAQNTSTQTPKLNHRHRHHMKRINNGVEDGTLTRSQAKQLRQEERAVKADRKAMKADGVVTKEERSKIKAEEKAVRHDIKRAKHQTKTNASK